MTEVLLAVGLVVLQSVALLVSLLIVIAFLLLADRKVWAAVQMRRGPNVVGPFGLFQSFATMSMGGDFATEAMGFGHDGLHFLKGERRMFRIIAERQHAPQCRQNTGIG